MKSSQISPLFGIVKGINLEEGNFVYETIDKEGPHSTDVVSSRDVANKAMVPFTREDRRDVLITEVKYVAVNATLPFGLLFLSARNKFWLTLVELEWDEPSEDPEWNNCFAVTSYSNQNLP